MIVALSSFQIYPAVNGGYDTDNLTVRWWYNRGFIDSTTVSVQGGNGQQGFYITSTCTVDVNGIITVPSTDIFSTLDAIDPSPQSIQFFGRLYSGNTPKQWVTAFSSTPTGWVVQDSSPLTYEDLVLQNQAIVLANPPEVFPTFAQMIAYIDSLVPTPLASDVVFGRTKLSIAAESSLNPVAWGINDASLPTGFLNVKGHPYYATGDGTTDDTVALQTAIDDAASAATVFIPPGVYKITESLIASGTTALAIKGSGLESKILNLASANKPSMRFTTKFQLLLEDFAIIGRTANPNEGILIESNSAYIVMNRVMTNSSGIGVHLQDSSSIWINNHQFWPSSFTNGATSTAGGIQLTNAILADGTFVNNVHINALNTNNYAKISDSGAAIRWNTPGFGASQGVTITGCELEDSVTPSRCIDLQGVTDVVIQGNYIDGTDVRVLQSRYVLVLSNYGGATTTYSVGDNDAGHENVNVLIEGAPTGSATFDQYCIQCGSKDSNFDTSGGYVNNGTRRVTQDTRSGVLGTQVADEIGYAGIKERDRTVPLGQFTTPTFSAGNFTVSPSGGWTLASGDVRTYEWQVVGTTMTVNFNLITTTVTGTPAALLIAIPGGYTSAARVSSVFIGNSNGGAYFTSEMEVTSGGVVIILYPALNAVGAWAAGTDNTNVRGSFSFEVS